MSKTKSERDVKRDQILNQIKSGCKDSGLDETSYPMTWQQKVLEDVDVIPTPSASLNAALGVGGFPKGRIIEIFGGASAGKTTLALQMIAQAQKMGLETGFIDMAQALDAKYAQDLGISMDDLFISQPQSGNDALKLAKVMCQTGLGLVIIDDVPSMVFEAESEKEITDNNIGIAARMMSQAVRQLQPLANRSGTCVVFINQIRFKIGVMYGNPETTPGGEALKFYTSMRLDMRGLGTPKPDDLSRKSRIKVVKNKLAPPYRECEVDIIFGKGIDQTSDTIRMAKTLKVIEQKGPWYILPLLNAPEGTELRFQGEEKVRSFIDMTPGYIEALAAAVQTASITGAIE